MADVSSCNALVRNSIFVQIIHIEYPMPFRLAVPKFFILKILYIHIELKWFDASTNLTA